MNDLKIGEGTQVSLHFALRLEDGQPVDSTFEREPAQLTIGDGNLPEAFENCIHGLKAGDKESFTLPPEKAFGQHNPSNIQMLSRSDFSNLDELEVGMILGFTDKGGNELPGVIAEIDERQVKVDFNHPLAGRTLTFDVEILDVAPASVQ
ncbi:FKBP-type peptidyl-prolyl cis-trans isomerase [Marinospirillum perlucidum]|uniref:FKBP-type peptidyl-prolyl cis-trans isomerase n=1 Tax=Marinospirillum perlucidum TaxID=1982602 RepID=UPI000DF3D021|nr:FKBP-type peptidyl-prolyl cis-trans isomerase [Marinospirillum perlucidum]